MRRTRKPVAAGVLSILAGTVAVGGGIAIILVGGGLTGLQMSTWADLLAGGRLSATLSGATILPPPLLGSLGAILTPSGILNITGGAECIRRHWKLALAGCLCATAVIPVIGPPAVVLVVLSRGEFQKRGADGNGVRNATNSG